MAARYKTYRAMEQAVKAAAKASGRDVNKVIQAFYHDRFLCRVFSADNPSFILKGGQSMLARIPNARETRDIDLIGRTSDIDEALEELINAASTDLGDFVEFRFASKRPTDTSQDYREGYTVTFETWLGGTSKKGTVSIDLVRFDASEADHGKEVGNKLAGVSLRRCGCPVSPQKRREFGRDD